MNFKNIFLLIKNHLALISYVNIMDKNVKLM